MTTEHDRRRFLRIAGTGAAASIAGCTDASLLNQDEDENGDDRLTAVVDVAQADVEELYDQLESGEIDRVEFQEEVEQRRQDAIDEFESYVDEEDVTVEESSDEVEGLYLIDGDDGAILGALRSGPLTVLYGSEAYDLIIEQQQQQQGPVPEEGAENETANEDTDESENGDDGSADDDSSDS
ncbi:hypothetical protein ACFO5R_06405 [Halosolutus amylolyticus]|uniref:Twin-arginine translocation signal domain-containing protein n=1 Tax=Halosolutus amylolyticus TaxID=2932267 RepID=A0ABD5PME7_9EURY|nr:hypothetical protein [Halosolutus amylolyticus]